MERDMMIFQCCYTSASYKTRGAAGWSFVNVSEKLPPNARAFCMNAQKFHASLRDNMRDQDGRRILRYTEVLSDGSFFYLIRTSYGLTQDDFKRSSLFSHAYIFPANDANILDPAFLFLKPECFKEREEDSRLSPSEVLDASVLLHKVPLSEAMAHTGLNDRKGYEQLIYCVYAQMSGGRTSPLAVEYDGTDKQLQYLLYCIYSALPFHLRRTLRSATYTEATRKELGRNINLIFTTDARSMRDMGCLYYIPPSRCENHKCLTNLSEDELEEMKSGYVGYAVQIPYPENFSGFFQSLEKYAEKLSAPDAPDDVFRNLALESHYYNDIWCLDAANVLKQLDEGKLRQLLLDIILSGKDTEEVKRLARDVIVTIKDRNILLSTDLTDLRNKYILDKNIQLVSEEPAKEESPKSTTVSSTATTRTKKTPIASTPQPRTTPSPATTKPKTIPASTSTTPTTATTTRIAANAAEANVVQKIMSGTKTDAMRVLFETYETNPVLYQDILRRMKQFQQGVSYLNEFYSRLMRQEQMYSWEQFERIANELPDSNRRAEIGRSLYANIWKFYSNEIGASENPRGTFDAFHKLVKRMYPNPENLLNEAKKLYWRTVSWDNFDADKIDEYRAFLIEGEPNEYYALARLAKEYYPGGEEEYLRKVFLYFDYSTPEGQKFGLAKATTPNARERIIAKLDDILRAKHGDAVPIYFRKWMSMASYVDKGPNCLPLIQALYSAMSNYDPKRLYAAYSDFYYKRNVDYLWGALGRPATELLRTTCEKNDSPKAPVPLDLWLWIAENESKGNFFEIFNSHSEAAVLSMNPTQVVADSRELKNEMIINMAVNYFTAKSNPKKIKNAVKAWAKATRH